ncbi:MAG: exodeoxyribonuclease VII large subunit, partial [Mariprofundaceae bacterium]
ARKRQALAALSGTIAALSPEQVLERGFALCLDAQGRVVSRAAALSPGATLRTRFHDGEAESRVERVRLVER